MLGGVGVDGGLFGRRPTVSLNLLCSFYCWGRALRRGGG